MFPARRTIYPEAVQETPRELIESAATFILHSLTLNMSQRCDHLVHDNLTVCAYYLNKEKRGWLHTGLREGLLQYCCFDRVKQARGQFCILLLQTESHFILRTASDATGIPIMTLMAAMPRRILLIFEGGVLSASFETNRRPVVITDVERHISFLPDPSFTRCRNDAIPGVNQQFINRINRFSRPSDIRRYYSFEHSSINDDFERRLSGHAVPAPPQRADVITLN